MASKYLLTGRPGIGKTTLARSVARDVHPLAGGIVTEETLEGRQRTGFRVVDLTRGKTAPLAHTGKGEGPRVGRYRVDIESFEAVGVAALSQALDHKGLIVIDEIGKMELFSERFKEVITRIFESTHPLLATIPQRRPRFVAELTLQADKIIEVTEANRNELPAQLLVDIRR